MDTAIIVAGIAAIGSFGTAYFSHRQHRATKAVREQVQNSHDTNLRDDIDRVLDGITSLVEGQRRHDSEIAGIREDQRIERRERMALAERIS